MCVCVCVCVRARVCVRVCVCVCVCGVYNGLFSLSQLALCMKWVSFVHENSYKVLYPWHKEDETGITIIEPHNHRDSVNI